MRAVAIVLLCLGLTAAGAARAQPDGLTPEKRAEIERLLEVTGAMAMTQQVAGFFVSHMAQTIRKQNPTVPQHVIDAIPEEVNDVIRESMPAYRDAILPIYARHFTLEELRGMNAFYSTPLGRKTIAVMPTLLQESMNAGQRWGQSMAPRIAERLRARFKRENLQI